MAETNEPINSPVKILRFLPVSIVLLLTANILLSLRGCVLRKNIRLKTTEYQQAEADLHHAKEQKQIGLMAASIRNEYAGWNALDPLPVHLVNFFSQHLNGIKIEGLYLQRPVLYRKLPANLSGENFSHSLAVAGILAVDFPEVADQETRRKMPLLVDAARASFRLPFLLDIPQTDEGDNPGAANWNLTSELTLEYLWAEIPTALDHEGGSNE